MALGTGLIAAFIAAGAAGLAGLPRAAMAREPVAQDLVKVRESGSISAAIWTVRSDSCTLQLVIPWHVRVDKHAQPQDRPTLPEIQVWLLNAGGTRLKPQAALMPDTSKAGVRTVSVDAMYLFELADCAAARAVAVRVDAQVYTESLRVHPGG